MRDLFQPRDGKELPPPGVVAEYDYLDEQGQVLYQAVRYEPKTFRQRRPCPKTGLWMYELGNVRLVPYRLPFWLSRASQPVCVVEGEKDCDRLALYGIEATTNVGGVGMGWRDEYSVPLAGRRVALIPDLDAPGLRHMERVLGSLLRHGVKSARWVELPDGKDASEYLSRHSREELIQTIRRAREYRGQ